MAWADVESRSDAFPYLFNRTALGLGVLLGLWHAYHRNWLPVVVIFGAMIPIYFALHRYVDAP